MPITNGISGSRLNQIVAEYGNIAWTTPSMYTIGTQEYYGTDRLASLESKLAREKTAMQNFLKTGQGSMQDSIYLQGKDDRLYMFGYNIREFGVGKCMFKIKNGKVYAIKKRTEHIKYYLNKLAKSQGLPLEYVNELIIEPGLRNILFYNLKGLQVDDSAHFKGSRMRVPELNEVALQPEPQLAHDSCDCDDCIDEEDPEIW